MRKIILFTSLIAMLLLAACGDEADTASEDDSSQAPITESTTSSNIPEDTQDPTFSGVGYTDEQVGFTINYPEDWTIIAPNVSETAISYVVTLQSFTPQQGGAGGSGGSGVPQGESKMDILITPDDDVTLETIRQRLQQQIDENTFVLESEEQITLETGIEALVIRGNGFRGGDFVTIYTAFDGSEVVFNIIGDEQFLFDVANTLRPSTG